MKKAFLIGACVLMVGCQEQEEKLNDGFRRPFIVRECLEWINKSTNDCKKHREDKYCAFGGTITKTSDIELCHGAKIHNE